MNKQHDNSAAESTEQSDRSRQRELSRLKRRYRRDRRFKLYTILALLTAAAFLVTFLADLAFRGYSALRQTEVHTTVSYDPDTILSPLTAYPEDTRDLVSREEVRKVFFDGCRAEIQVNVTYGAATKTEPTDGIQATTLTEDDFPIFLQEEAPVEVPREHLLAMIDHEGLQQVQELLRNEASPNEDSQLVWLRGSPGLQQFLTDSTGLDESVKESAAMLDYAGRLRLDFNRTKYGDGKTVEEWALADSDVDQYVKGKYSEIGYRATSYETIMLAIDRTPIAEPDIQAIIEKVRARNQQPAEDSNANPIAVPSEELLEQCVQAWNTRNRIDKLREEGRIRLVFNHYFFTNGDSKLPEAAGMKSAIMGSIYVLVIVFFICVPTGVLTSIYLEEFASDNWLTQLIEVNINNLAAIPSILFGVLGLAALINFLGIPRASVMVGGATLALMTLPIIIISSRAALRAVPDSIRMAGFAMGATRWQVVTHHVLPAALSGIMTGSIIGIAQAMGETAPLIIVGLVAFVPDAPLSPLDASTVMPAQIFSWWEMPQRAFEERAALAILLLLGVLFVLNGIALVIRARSERRW